MVLQGFATLRCSYKEDPSSGCPPCLLLETDPCMPPILESLFVFVLLGWVGAHNCTRDLFMYGGFSLNDLGSYTIRNAALI